MAPTSRRSALAARVAAAAIVASAALAVAQAQCSVSAGGLYFDLSQANNGAYGTRTAADPVGLWRR